MQIGYFTERPYRWLPEELILKNRAFFAISNRYFDREKAADDYHYYLDEYCYAEDLGFDVLALNEHHGNPQRMIDAKRQQHNSMSQADVFGFRRQMTQYEFGRRAVRKPWQKVMFGKPHPFVSELIREQHLL